MGNYNTERYDYFQRVNASKARREAIKKERREAFLKEYGRRKREEYANKIVWFKDSNSPFQKAQIKNGITTIRRLLGSISEIPLENGVCILYNACAEELGFGFNLKINGIKIFGPVILCCKRGFEYIDCTLTKAEVEKYFN